MDLAPALVVGLGLPAVALLVGLAWRARDGRVRRIRGRGDVPAAAASAIHPGATASAPEAERLGLAGDALGAGATLVQFSTEFCSRCPGTARVLAELASEYGDVRHVDIDLTHRGDLADAFRVTQTPTVLVLGADGRATARVAGVPRIDELRDELDTTTGRSRVRHHA
ncbi:thioredoxin family protein [Agromyces kandeliae]|uniref:Thioredoxin n=1 Tax=Agromyces kandeliae TaxID=2666141 RepID=A0A6L5R0L8_9MICO|nr:thioredoxin family protein [Agromyces kandeliae]MRX42617.1 thioredoxin [Agromyces kandeliae]